MKTLQAVNGVRSVAVTLETKSVVIEGDGLVENDLRGAVEEAGYQATHVS